MCGNVLIWSPAKMLTSQVLEGQALASTAKHENQTPTLQFPQSNIDLPYLIRRYLHDILVCQFVILAYGVETLHPAKPQPLDEYSNIEYPHTNEGYTSEDSRDPERVYGSLQNAT
jgi:hypothetical protein